MKQLAIAIFLVIFAAANATACPSETENQAANMALLDAALLKAKSGSKVSRKNLAEAQKLRAAVVDAYDRKQNAAAEAFHVMAMTALGYKMVPRREGCSPYWEPNG